MLHANRNKDGDILEWSDIVHALKNTHTISTKGICESLKTSRTWVNRYILPHVNSIYISNGIISGEKVSVQWTKIAEREIGRELVETTWFDTEEYLNLLSQHITVSRQTRKIPMEMLFKNPEEYIMKRKLLEKEYEEEKRKKNKDKAKLQGILYEAKKLEEECMSKSGKKVFTEGKTFITKRSDAEFMEIRVPEDFVRQTLSSWTTPHSEKDYGDTDEKVHRKFFREGYLKIVLEMPDADGVLGKKVFYVKDPEEIEVRTEQYITVKESVYRKYRAELNHSWAERNKKRKNECAKSRTGIDRGEDKMLESLIINKEERMHFLNYCHKKGMEPTEMIRNYIKKCISNE